MKKILIVVIILAVIGGGVFYYLQSKKNSPQPDKPDKTWSVYSTDENQMVTLNDYMTAVAGGAHIAKFTVTVKFTDKTGYEKFMGFNKPMTDKEYQTAIASAATSSSSSKPTDVTPMNVKINSSITNFMLNLTDAQSKNLDYIQKNLRDYLNEQVGLDKNLIDTVYIEQYVMN